MRKLYEAYLVDNGLLIKKSNTVYHLFYESTETTTDTIKIADQKELCLFLVSLFENSLKFDHKTKLNQETFKRTHEVTLTWEED